MDGKDSMESLRKAWIIEMGELTSLRKSEVETVKAFISKQTDIYRPAYGRTPIEYPRQCVFCGTTNEEFFLKGDTGNRRFWVIEIRPELRSEDDFRTALMRDRDQLWAEAVYRYKEGEKLYLDADLEKEARQLQEEHNENEIDDLASQVEQFLETKLPYGWEEKTRQERYLWYNNGDGMKAQGVKKRMRACTAEFLCEYLGLRVSDREFRSMNKRVARIFDRIPGWRRVSTSRHAEALYGRQRAWERLDQSDDAYHGDEKQEEDKKYFWEEDDDL